MGCSVCVCVWCGGGAIRHSLIAFRSLQAQRLRGMLAPGPRAKGAAAWQGRTGLVVHLMQGPGAGTPGTQLLTGQLAAPALAAPQAQRIKQNLGGSHSSAAGWPALRDRPDSG